MHFQLQESWWQRMHPYHADPSIVLIRKGHGVAAMCRSLSVRRLSYQIPGSLRLGSASQSGSSVRKHRVAQRIDGVGGLR